MIRIRYIYVFCLLLFFLAGTGYSQNKTTLQNKKKKLQKEINYTNTLIKKNKKKQEASLEQLKKINANIDTRVELVNNYTEEINTLSGEIHLSEGQVNSLEKQLDILKRSYSKMVYQAWKTRNSLSTWMYIFSADNFNQAVRRYRYFKQINELRVIQSKSITKSKHDLVTQIGKLKQSKADKENVISEKNGELKMLEDEKKDKDQNLKKLKKKEKDLLAQVKKQEKEKDALTAKINSIVETIIPKKTTTKKNTNSTHSTTKTTTTKTEVSNTKGNSNSSGFEANKGKLSWPVTKGVITGKFGVHPHPVLDKVEVKNDGIDISTDKGATVRAVYKGTVSGVFKVDGFENVVIIRHGDYLTVYSHLSQTSVSKGNEVSTEQKIGTAATDSEGDTFINFQVRYGSTVQNPSSWLTK